MSYHMICCNIIIMKSSRENSADMTRMDDPTAIRSCTLHVCTSCRPRGMPRQPREQRPGFRLYQALCDAFDADPLQDWGDVRAADCLSLCPRPCGIALSSPGAWSYLFGDQQPDPRDIVECVRTYVCSADGSLPRDHRPESMRASILGRLPPSTGA